MGTMREFLPSRTVFGLASIDGRTVALSGEDFTARPASGSSGVSNREELEAKLISTRSPFRTAEPFNIEDIIDPRDTRPVLHE